jgi:hypothetical protein
MQTEETVETADTQEEKVNVQPKVKKMTTKKKATKPAKKATAKKSTKPLKRKAASKSAPKAEKKAKEKKEFVWPEWSTSQFGFTEAEWKKVGALAKARGGLAIRPLMRECVLHFCK